MRSEPERSRPANPRVEIDTPATPAYIRWRRRAEEKMTKGTFGEHLKREREMRGVSLDEITAATRIATRFLRAIENEQWDQLPGGIFNRGFVRAMAHYLGLDEESIVAEYALAVGDRPNVPVWTGSPPAVTPDQPWLAWILVAVFVIMLIAGGWFAMRRISAWRASRRGARNAAVSAVPTPAPPAVPPAADAVPPSNDAGANSAAAPPAPSAVADTSPAPAIGLISAALSPFELKIETGKATRVTVETDAHRVFEATMKAGESHTFTAQDKFQVSARDAGALLLELNGKTLAPIGPPGHAGKVTLTRETLKGAVGGKN
jgi:cytoskeleton protein RodZ